MSRTPVIGIAGGIGSGKSAVARALADLGCVVTDSDADGRAALRDPRIIEAVVSCWGRTVLDEHGAVDRSALARIVFHDAEQRRRLESITHPWIEARRRERFAGAPEGTPALVIDAPLLYEVGLDEQCDAVIFVEAPREARLDRVRQTRGWGEAELRRREESQLPLDEKRSRADYVIWNDGTLTDLVDRVRPILTEITRGPADSKPDAERP